MEVGQSDSDKQASKQQTNIVQDQPRRSDPARRIRSGLRVWPFSLVLRPGFPRPDGLFASFIKTNDEGLWVGQALARGSAAHAALASRRALSARRCNHASCFSESRGKPTTSL